MANYNGNQDDDDGNSNPAHYGNLRPMQSGETRVSMFKNAKNLHIDGGEYSIGGGDVYYGPPPPGGYGPRPQLGNRHISSFEGVDGAIIRNGNFRAVAGDTFYATSPPPPMRSPTNGYGGYQQYPAMAPPVQNRGNSQGRYEERSNHSLGRGNTLGAAPTDRYGTTHGQGGVPVHRPHGRVGNAPRSRNTLPQNNSPWGSSSNGVSQVLSAPLPTPPPTEYSDEEVEEGQDSPPTTMLDIEIDPSEEPRRNVHRSNTF